MWFKLTHEFWTVKLKTLVKLLQMLFFAYPKCDIIL